FLFFHPPATPEISTLSLHDALPIFFDIFYIPGIDIPHLRVLYKPQFEPSVVGCVTDSVIGMRLSHLIQPRRPQEGIGDMSFDRWRLANHVEPFVGFQQGYHLGSRQGCPRWQALMGSEFLNDYRVGLVQANPSRDRRPVLFLTYSQ